MIRCTGGPTLSSAQLQVVPIELIIREEQIPVEFLFTDWLGTPAWFWLAFLGLVVTLTAFDLGILHKEDREMGIAESLKLSVFYITIALLFGGWIWYARGSEPGMQYFTGFFIEKALSIDNVFVISLIFSYFAIPAKYQYRALLWGIMAVIVLRGIMIAGGAALVNEFYWVLYLFAAFLIVTGIKMFFSGDEEMDVANNPIVKFISRHMPVTDTQHGEKFFVKVPDPKTGKLVRAATPLSSRLLRSVSPFRSCSPIAPRFRYARARRSSTATRAMFRTIRQNSSSAQRLAKPRVLADTMTASWE